MVKLQFRETDMDNRKLGQFPRRGVQRCCKLCLVVWAVLGFLSCSSDIVDGDRDAGLPDADMETGETDTREDAKNGDSIENNGTSPADNNGEDEWTTPDWEECDCEHPDDNCHRATCGRPGIECGPGGEECPEDYSCTSTGGPPETWFCKCEGDRAECGPYCDEKVPDACPAGRVCDLNDGVCRSGGGCTHQAHCPEGQACVDPDNPFGYPGWCYETGDLEEGDPCDEHLECQSGKCLSGVCVRRCFNDGDCDENKACTSTGCDNVSSDCAGDCPDQRRCISDECRNPFCHNSGDCDDADCVWQGPSRPLLCEEHPDEDRDYACKPEEYLSSSGDSCILPGTCWEDEDCGGDPYECDGSLCRRHIEDGRPS